MHGEFENPLLVAGRTEAPYLAEEGNEHVMPAIVTADSGKSLTQISALDEPFGCNIDYRTPETVSCRESLGINIFEFIIIGMDDFPEG